MVSWCVGVIWFRLSGLQVYVEYEFWDRPARAYLQKYGYVYLINVHAPFLFMCGLFFGVVFRISCILL